MIVRTCYLEVHSVTCSRGFCASQQRRGCRRAYNVTQSSQTVTQLATSEVSNRFSYKVCVRACTLHHVTLSSKKGVSALYLVFELRVRL